MRQNKPGTEIEVVGIITASDSLARPLFASQVPCGFPSPADDYVEQSLDLNEYFITRPEATFYCRVSGESMSGAGILDGDVLIVDRSVDARHDDIVVAIVNDELTIKRLYRRGNHIELRPENQAFRPIVLQPGSELIVWGVVIGVTRKLKTA